MLSKQHSQAYQEFLLLLQKLQNNFESDTGEIDILSLQKQFPTLQTFFQQQITVLTGQELDPAIATRWQSLQTEMHRELRLLNTDILFLASARQAETRSQRLTAVRDRLQRIIGYCTAIKSL